VTLSPAQVAASVSTVQDVIDGLFTISKTKDPDAAMAIALTQGMYLGIANPELARTLAGSVDILLGNPDARPEAQGVIAGTIGAMYDNYLAKATAFVDSDPRIKALAAEAQSELEARGR
jgi:hypothetical protein